MHVCTQAYIHIHMYSMHTERERCVHILLLVCCSVLTEKKRAVVVSLSICVVHGCEPSCILCSWISCEQAYVQQKVHGEGGGGGGRGVGE